MQTRPANWETLLYDINHKTEYRYIINGVEYTGDYVQDPCSEPYFPFGKRKLVERNWRSTNGNSGITIRH